MIPIIIGSLIFLLFVLKVLSIWFTAGLLTFVSNWFVWLFAFLFFILLYSTTKQALLSALYSAVVGLVMRFVFKV